MIAAVMEQKKAAGEGKMLWVAWTKVNVRRISAAIIAADE
jgi:hypothetical protein